MHRAGGAMVTVHDDEIGLPFRLFGNINLRLAIEDAVGRVTLADICQRGEAAARTDKNSKQRIKLLPVVLMSIAPLVGVTQVYQNRRTADLAGDSRFSGFGCCADCAESLRDAVTSRIAAVAQFANRIEARIAVRRVGGIQKLAPSRGIGVGRAVLKDAGLKMRRLGENRGPPAVTSATYVPTFSSFTE